MQAEPTNNSFSSAARRRSGTRSMVVTGMLSAIAFVLMFVEFPIPALIPPFVRLDFSDLPELLGAFALGPVYGVVISLLKNVLIVVIKGSGTGSIGEICNFILGATFSLSAGWIYKKHKNLKGAIIGSLVGAVLMALISVPANYWISYPAYIHFYGMPLDVILGMYQAILPSADTLLKCLLIFNMPFTLVKGLLDVALCFMVYKPLSPILHGRK
jgi:riboflavin transporter FmnP